MRDRTTGEHSRVLSDVSLVPETLGISIMWLAKLAGVCIVILWAAIIDINFLPIAILVDIGVIIVAFAGRLVTPSHLDSFSDYLRAVFVERWGSARLVSEPSPILTMSKHDSITDIDASSSHTNNGSEPDQPQQNGQTQRRFDLSQLSQLSNFSRFTNGGTNTQSTGVDLSRLGNGIDLSSIGDSLLGSDRTVVDLAPITTAYRNSFAVERTDEAVIGAVKIEPASMSMVDDIEPHILGFASVLAASTIHKGMLIDVPRSVDYSNRWERYRAHKERLAEQDTWTAQLQADLCEERETIASLYEQTTTQRDHYIIVEVDKREAAKTLSNDDGGLADLPFIGDFIAEGNAERLRDKNRLQAVMVELLERRMGWARKDTQRSRWHLRPVSTIL